MNNSKITQHLFTRPLLRVLSFSSGLRAHFVAGRTRARARLRHDAHLLFALRPRFPFRSLHPLPPLAIAHGSPRDRAEQNL